MIWLAIALASTASAGTFGTVVPIGGHASDIALDEERGVVYVANFTANRIEVVSIASQRVQSSINIGRQPAALALSPNGQYLIATHLTATGVGLNSLTILDLVNNTTRQFSFGKLVLGVAFGSDGKAMVLTADEWVQLDPATAYATTIMTMPELTAALPPQEVPCEPRNFVKASLASSGDMSKIWGIADVGATDCGEGDSFLVFSYDVRFKGIRGEIWTASPTEGPRVIATDRTGSIGITGWSIFRPSPSGGFFVPAEFLNPSGLYAIGTHAIDSAKQRVYAQVEKKSILGQSTFASDADRPQLLVADLDNLTVNEKLMLPEHAAGRSILDKAGNVMYTVSQSGLMILPVGALDRMHRVYADQEDILITGNWCDRRSVQKQLVISNPGGGSTPFALSTTMPGVTLSPSEGTTPATVTVTIDTYTFHDVNGTTEGAIDISSPAAVNIIPSVRVLVNNREPDQRGTIVNVPGTLVDLAADPVQNRFYVLRQDKNRVEVLHGSNYNKIATMRTGTTPTSMAITQDRRYLIVGADNSQVANVYDLATMQFLRYIVFPSGHYPRAIAASNRGILAVSRLAGEEADCGTGKATIDRIDVANGFAKPLPMLGVWKNCVSIDTGLTPSANGNTILAAQPDGTLMLYDAEVDDFTVAHKDFSSLSGAYGAIANDEYVVGNMLLNSSLQPIATMSDLGSTSGVIVSDGIAVRTAASTSAKAGMVERVNCTNGLSIRGARMAEAPLLSDSSVVGRTFTRTFTALPSRAAFAGLSTSGVTVLPWEYDAAVAIPAMNTVVNAANGGSDTAPGGLITVWGKDLTPVSQGTSEMPLPTLLGDSCLSIGGQLVPMLFVSPGQINAQLPYNVQGSTSMVLHTPAGVSNTLKFTVPATAPAVFNVNVEGWGGVPAIVRHTNNQVVTLSNPVHPDDWLEIYLTGMGAVTPDVDAGDPAPVDPLAWTTVEPAVTLGGVSLPVGYYGLSPFTAGLNQINVKVPFKDVPTGMSVPLTITQGSTQTTVHVRVVN